MSNFGRSILEKYGWQAGKGLGREETGISTAIKVKGNFNTYGLGHDVGQEFTDQWWDHLYNATADSITVGTSENGCVKFTRKEDQSDSKNIIPYAKAETNQYSRFVKGGTMTDHRKEKFGERETLSFDKLFKICGGKTAHKGARHGLTMTAKLARVQQQELDLMEKLSNSEHSRKYKNEEKTLSDSMINENSENSRRKKKKSRRERMISEDEKLNGMQNEDLYKRVKKKKKQDQNLEKGLEECVHQNEDRHLSSEKLSPPLKKNKRKDKNTYNHYEDLQLENETNIMYKQTKKKLKKSKKLAREYEGCSSDNV